MGKQGNGKIAITRGSGAAAFRGEEAGHRPAQAVVLKSRPVFLCRNRGKIRSELNLLSFDEDCPVAVEREFLDRADAIRRRLLQLKDSL